MGKHERVQWWRERDIEDFLTVTLNFEVDVCNEDFFAVYWISILWINNGGSYTRIGMTDKESIDDSCMINHNDNTFVNMGETTFITTV